MNDLMILLNKEQISKINNHNIKQFSKTPVLNYLNKKNKHMHKREHLSILTQLFSDQIHLAKNDNQRDPQVVPFCRHCPDIKESAEHFLLHCPAYSLHRLKNFGSLSPRLENMFKFHNAKEIIKYVNDTQRLEDKYVCYYVE
jgi:hypothetical protein